MDRHIAESLILSELDAWQSYMEEIFRGHEQLAILEICRSLDLVFTRSEEARRNGGSQSRDDYYARCGVPEALAPFLTQENELRTGCQWTHSEPERASLVHTYLVTCGELVDNLRTVALERYGLAEVTVAEDVIHVNVRSDRAERVSTRLRRAIAGLHVDSGASTPTSDVRDWMLNNVRRDESIFISYDLHPDVEREFHSLASSRRPLFPESEALPDECVIGGRTFADWRDECERACARVLRHMEFIRLLRFKDSQLEDPRDMLTVIHTRDEVRHTLEMGGTPKALVDTTLRALTTTATDLAEYSSMFEPPAAPYLSLGKDYLLAPCYGMIGNPYFTMFRHLRRHYRSDWDAAVDQREAQFRTEVADLFGAERFYVLGSGLRIKRDNGSHATDIDAIVFDRRTGSLALIQLKWHDPYGRSITERESRRKNLAKAEDWVTRVQAWLADRSSDEVIKTVGLPASAATRITPYIYVVSRYASRFAVDDRFDSGSTWLSWPELVYAVGSASSDPIREVAAWVRSEMSRTYSRQSHFQMSEFSNFSVVVHAEIDLDDDV